MRLGSERAEVAVGHVEAAKRSNGLADDLALLGCAGGDEPG